MTKENDFITATGARLHYLLVGASTLPPLVLIHGQGMCGRDYEPVFADLGKKHTVYAVDCFGHGQSEKGAALYRCEVIGDAICDFIQTVIAGSCIVSGHSSGGILACYVAGKLPQLVTGLLLEDPPFFNVQPGEFENTFVYKDSFLVTHRFLQQTTETDYLPFYIEHGYIYNYLGQRFFGKDWAHQLAEEARAKRRLAPDKLPDLQKVPAKSFHGLAYMDQFDPLFSESFFTGSWFDNVDQAALLASVRCPTVYLKAKTKMGKDGVLWAANSDAAAERMMQLLAQAQQKTVRSGHDIHFEHPRHFLKAMRQLEKMMK